MKNFYSNSPIFQNRLENKFLVKNMHCNKYGYYKYLPK